MQKQGRTKYFMTLGKAFNRGKGRMGAAGAFALINIAKWCIAPVPIDNCSLKGSL